MTRSRSCSRSCSFACATLLAGTSLTFGIFACSSDDTSNATSSSSSSSGDSSSSGASQTAVPAAECSSRCTSKLATCQAPAAQAKQGCDQNCAGGLTESQVSCIEAKDCEALGNAKSLTELCAPSTGGTNSSSGTSTSSGGLPTTLTVTGSIPSGYKPTHIKDGNTIATSFNVAPEPQYSPSKPSQVPNVGDKGVSVVVDSPDLGNCKSKPTFTLSTTQVSVVLIGEDTLPDTDCATWADKAASDGFKATLSNVPYPNTSTKATVTIELK